MKRRLPILILLLLAAGGVAAWRVWVWKNGSHGFLYAGTIEADEVDLSSGVPSTIQSIDVKEGDRVKKGQALVRLDCNDVRVAAEQANTDFARSAALFKAGSLSKAAFDRAKTQRDDAQVRTGWCTIASPLDGTVLNVFHLAGEWARPGVNILSVADVSRVYAYVYVPQPMLARLSLRQPVVGRLPEMPERRFAGSIEYIRPEAEFTPKNVQTEDERERLVYGVKVRFEGSEGTLKPGMTIETDLSRPGEAGR